MDAKQRKRRAVTALRDVADNMGMSPDRRNSDLNMVNFRKLHNNIVGANSATPEQKRKADDALNQFLGEITVSLPPLPTYSSNVQASSSSRTSTQTVPAQTAFPSQGGARGPFRLTSGSCLFTWNNGRFANAAKDVLWHAFLAFIYSLSFIRSWTATMERSLLSGDIGRIRLHCFMEFSTSVD